jgi:DNA-binding transcriptional ArsR family regulator
MQPPVEIVRDVAIASALLDPQRMRLLGMLAEPDSATGLARRLELPRQKLNYHLRELEKAGLVRLVGERKKGNCTERMLQATAGTYLISPDVVGKLAPSPGTGQDQFSSAWLVALSARTISELAQLQERSAKAGKKLATLALTANVRFSSPATRAAFAADMTEAFAKVVARYDDQAAPGGRTFRVMFSGYPFPSNPAPSKME